MGKRLLLTITTLGIFSVVHGQWLTNGDHIYYNAGSVGIGINSPLSKLHIFDSGPSELTLRIKDNSWADNEWKGIGFTGNNGELARIAYRYHPNSLEFVVNNSRHMVIEQGGNVGIGTTNPKKALHVVGNGYFQKKDGSKLNGIEINNQNDNGNRTWILWNFNDYFGETGFSIYEYWDADGDGNKCSDDDGSYCTNRFFIQTGGNVGIGTNEPTAKLAVNGTAKAKEMIVTEQSEDWPDYVLDTGYQMHDLRELERFIEENRHLPGIPTKEEVEKRGQNLGAIQAKLLEKIEELTLIVIQQQKEIEELKSRKH